MNSRGQISTAMMVLVGVAIIAIGGLAFYSYHVTSTTPASVAPNNNSSTVATSAEPTVPGTGPAVPTVAITPESGTVGTQVTIYGSGFAATGNTVTLNGMVSGSLKDLLSPDGKTIVFTIPSSLGPNCKPDEACPQYMMLVTNGKYSIAVISNGATQTIGTFTVTGKPLQVP